MTQLNGFMNITQIRKLTQEMLKPVVQEIQTQMTKMRKQSQFLKQQSQKAQQLYEKQYKMEQYVQSNKEDIRFIKIKLEELKDQDIKNMLQVKKDVTSIYDQIDLLKKQRSKYQELFKKFKAQNDRTIAQFATYQTWMNEKAESMNQQFLKVKNETLHMTTNVKLQYQQSKIKYQELQKSIQNKLKINEKKYEILDLYLRERQQNKCKIIEIQQKFSNYALISSIEYLRQCQIKQLQMNKKQVNQIMDTYLPPQILNMLPTISKRVQQIEKMEKQIHIIKTNVFQSEQELQNFKQSTQTLQSNFKKQFKEINQKVNQNIETLTKNVEVVLQIEEKQQKARQKFQKQFKSELEVIVQKKNTQMSQAIKQYTSQKLQTQKQQDSKQIKMQRDIIEAKVQQIKVISDSLNSILTSYSNRITKCRSDTQLFKEEVNKELKQIFSLKQENSDRFQDIGKILASFTELFMLNASISLNFDSLSKQKDIFAFSTFNDGLIYQTDKTNNKNGQQIIYRRQKMEIPHLRRSILNGIVSLVDQIYESYSYLRWQNYQPSQFFKDEIACNYQIQLQKYGSWTGDLIQNKKSKKGEIDQSKTSCQLRYPSQNYNIKTTLTANDTLNMKQTFPDNKEYKKISNQNADLMISKQGSTINYEHIQEFPITIQTIDQQNYQSNRFVLSGFGNRSISRDGHLQYPPRSAGSKRRYMVKSKKDISNRYNDGQTFMTSRSSKRTSIGQYKI